MMELFAPEAIAALFQVVMIDLALAGDNAIVVGMAAAGLPEQQRTRAILFGMAGATALLIIFAGVTTQLLKLVGLLFAGGVLLLWVCWKIWRELRATANEEEEEAVEALTGLDISADGTVAVHAPRTSECEGHGQERRVARIAPTRHGRPSGLERAKRGFHEGRRVAPDDRDRRPERHGDRHQQRGPRQHGPWPREPDAA
jgi:hypothetical protein